MIQAMMARYHSLALRPRENVRQLGMESYTPDEHLFPVATAIYGPEDISMGEIVIYLFENTTSRT